MVSQSETHGVEMKAPLVIAHDILVFLENVQAGEHEKVAGIDIVRQVLTTPGFSTFFVRPLSEESTEVTIRSHCR